MITARRTVAPLAAALAALALLATPTRADAQARKRSTPAAAPARTSKAVEVPLPPPPAAARPSAAPAPAARGDWLGLVAGPWVGLDRGGGFAVTVDYGRVATPAGWRRAELELHLPVTFARPTSEEDLTVSFDFMGETFTDTLGRREDTANLVEVLPTARVRLPLGAARTAALFVDGGLGLVFGVLRETDDLRFEGRTTTTDAAVAVGLRLGAGLAYDASPRLRLLFQPVALTLHAGSDWSSFTALAGLSYRL